MHSQIGPIGADARHPFKGYATLGLGTRSTQNGDVPDNLVQTILDNAAACNSASPQRERSDRVTNGPAIIGRAHAHVLEKDTKDLVGRIPDLQSYFCDREISVFKKLAVFLQPKPRQDRPDPRASSLRSFPTRSHTAVEAEYFSAPLKVENLWLRMAQVITALVLPSS